MTTPTAVRAADVNVDDSVCVAVEHQLHLLSVVGDTTLWTYRFPHELSLIGSTRIDCQVQVLGTARDGIWQWAWDDEDLPRAVTSDARHVQAFGQRHHVDLFTTARIPVADTHAVTALVTATKPVTAAWTSFSFTPQPGWIVYVGIDDPALVLPDPTPLVVAKTLSTAADSMVDVRAAIDAYAQWRELGIMHHTKAVVVGEKEWRVTATLDDADRIAHIDVEGPR